MNKFKNNILFIESVELVKKYDSKCIYKSNETKEALFKKYMACDRNFRADIFSEKLKLIIEINGGEYMSKGRHTWGKGYQRDLEKSNIAQLNGYIYLQYTYSHLKNGELIKDFKKLLKIRKIKS
jgi:hypothetical protein